nr:hypothetical protein [Sicyoidochytrium minutum DNA virus]
MQLPCLYEVAERKNVLRYTKNKIMPVKRKPVKRRATKSKAKTALTKSKTLRSNPAYKKRYLTKVRELRKQYPYFHPVPKSSVTVKKAKSYFGGTFPKVNGKVHKYPRPDDEEAWVWLIVEALTYKKLQWYIMRYRLPKKKEPRRSQYEYVLYHGRPDQIKRRAKRNKDRRALGLTVGDPRHVHHMKQDDLDIKHTVLLTQCEHKRLHGGRCLTEDRPAPRVSYKRKPGSKKISTKKKKKAPAIRAKRKKPVRRVK